MRTAEEVMMRCKLILDQPDIVLLVDKSSSPTAAYDIGHGRNPQRRDRESGSLARCIETGLSRSLRRNHPQHSQPRSEEHGEERRTR